MCTVRLGCVQRYLFKKFKRPTKSVESRDWEGAREREKEREKERQRRGESFNQILTNNPTVASFEAQRERERRGEERRGEVRPAASRLATLVEAEQCNRRTRKKCPHGVFANPLLVTMTIISVRAQRCAVCVQLACWKVTLVLLHFAEFRMRIRVLFFVFNPMNLNFFLFNGQNPSSPSVPKCWH